MPVNLQSGDLGAAAPPFKVRDAQAINSSLDADALPHGFTAVPVMNVEKGNPISFRTSGCARIHEANLAF